MTTFEHAMLGVNGTLAVGLHRRHGWKIAAVAAAAAVAPDWDGLTVLLSGPLFDAAHRLWGHNLLACAAVGLLLGGLDYRFDLVTRAARRLVPILPLDRHTAALDLRRQYSWRGFSLWLTVASAAALSHLIGDMVVSGTATLPHWELQPYWPLSRRSVIMPMVSWGDAGISIVFAAGMLAMVRFRSALPTVAVVTLVGVVGYVVVRGIAP